MQDLTALAALLHNQPLNISARPRIYKLLLLYFYYTQHIINKNLLAFKRFNRQFTSRRFQLGVNDHDFCYILYTYIFVCVCASKLDSTHEYSLSMHTILIASTMVHKYAGWQKSNSLIFVRWTLPSCKIIVRWEHPSFIKVTFQPPCMCVYRILCTQPHIHIHPYLSFPSLSSSFTLSSLSLRTYKYPDSYQTV